MQKELVIADNKYQQWVADLSKRYQRSQIKAAASVNSEMLKFYWSLGRDVAQLQAESKWGSGFIRQLSKDLQHIIPNAKGLSRTNILYMINFYKLFPFDEIVPQVGGQFKDSIVPQDDGQIAEPGVELINAVFSIPWGHHKLLIDKCGKDREKASFYVQQTLVNNWSRAVLLNWLDTDLYERQGKAITNFTLTLPEPQSDLAQEMTRDGRLANSDRGLILVFELDDTIMFEPNREEYTDPVTGKVKKRQVKYYPDFYKDRIGRSYNDYEAARQLNQFEDMGTYEGSEQLEHDVQEAAVDNAATTEEMSVMSDATNPYSIHASNATVTLPAASYAPGFPFQSERNEVMACAK